MGPNYAKIYQAPSGPLVRALRARAGVLLLITNEFSTEGLIYEINRKK